MTIIFYNVRSIFFFFFQAEDGIRDGHVTGVQTCALPIFHLPYKALSHLVSKYFHKWVNRLCLGLRWKHHISPVLHRPFVTRSEERRVGKDCVSRSRQDNYIKKQKNIIRTQTICDCTKNII